MARKNNASAAVKTSVAKTPTPAPEAITTAVRNTAIPPRPAPPVAAPVKKTPPTYDDIALRAFLIWKEKGGNQLDNWVQAERELAV